MKTVWTKDLKTDDLKAEFKTAYVASKRVRDRLSTLISEKIETNRTKRRSEEGYESPNWSHKQADSIGYERALYEVLSLLD